MRNDLRGERSPFEMSIKEDWINDLVDFINLKCGKLDAGDESEVRRMLGKLTKRELSTLLRVLEAKAQGGAP